MINPDLHKHRIVYLIQDLIPYINWSYFFHAWNFEMRFSRIADIHGCDACRASWLTAFPEEDRPKASEAMQLYKEAQRMLAELNEDHRVQALFKLCKANADGDNLILDGMIFPLLRQQAHHKSNQPNLSLSDFVMPLDYGDTDIVGVFATSVDKNTELLYAKDPYKRMLIQTLADRLAEAATEKMHEEIRKTYWGYAADENLSIKDMFSVKYQGIRPAVGYPSLPDQSVNFIIDDILNIKEIGIDLTENGAMYPHASVTGLLFSHPSSRYFSIGKIDDIQLRDYAVRRKKPIEEMRKFLAGNLH